MICRNKNKECLAFLSFELISKDNPICDLGYSIAYDSDNDCFYCSNCKKFYSFMEDLINRKKNRREDKMNKCRYFRIVKIIYGNESKIENSFGFCCKDGYENDELLSCFEPSCCCFSLSKENDPVID